ncbi:hypothetical protein SGFS_061890 [Streptomyces graminofaciens]|uniref:Knr4/Smi1-like domain-containing protein n=1 Tax=Streptomyces graminofaciens TaxID=68212 RepID=A0ABM7FFD8_9ACTN|nr:SMI1/KNR4 family protein [Streptomyces graminofaciens]BBC34895.1 hypothetical protein SGFS_061890 [Streptomyces graminofaciens]
MTPGRRWGGPSADAYDRLVRLVAPPAVAVEAHGDWDAVESSLGVRLPGDYRRMVETYGWGEFCDFLYLRTPFGTSAHNGLAWQAGRETGVPEWDRERYPYPLRPAPGALLLWGRTMDADRLCWLTEGEPEEWPVVVWSRDGWYETHATGAAGFVGGWAGATLTSPLLVDMEPDLAPWFNAFRPRLHRCLRLSEGPYAHPERLRRLRAALAPTVDRGSWRSEPHESAHESAHESGYASGYESAQDHFATVDSDWLITYDMARPHQIRISFPPEHRGRARRRILAAVRDMGCRVLEITTVGGRTLEDWDAATEEDG